MNVPPTAAEATKPKGSVSAFRRNGSPYWYVRGDIKGVGNVTLSTHTTSKPRAPRFDDLVLALRDDGRLDVIRALKQRRINSRRCPANHRTMTFALRSRRTATTA